ncbi:PREDICTED: glucose dehydrogenase [FAD, quinone]-like, partial [Nicrophorus vespilloides]|uniref:Glucose dehydrogenase [FAD, quinone]-like n=1 Tax=Nicrophorus vespilloides TaxID=110193 RepID=A0ABM1MIN5_NICVS
KLLYILVIHHSVRAYDEATILYFENLINSTINETANYVIPTSSEEFRGNYYCSKDAKDFGSYDFIIVGSGSTGATLAARLAEEEKFKILLIEAGGAENNFTDIPGLYFYSRFTDYNWGYFSVPQEHACLGMKDRRCPFPRGKAVGGTTVINGLIDSRGNRDDFDTWNQLVNGSWSYEEVLPYFKKIEDSHIDGDPGYHGEDGPFPVYYHNPISPQVDAYLGANEELGYKVLDFNGAHQIGVSRNQLNNIKGRRVSTAKAYLDPARKYSNLKIVDKAYVTRVLIDDKTAYGVEFMLNGEKTIAKVEKEVIVSGGVIASPFILMHSGIGPKLELEKYNIPVVKDLPVGSNLHDHPTFYGLSFRTNFNQPKYTQREYIEQYLDGKGDFTIAANLQGIGYYQSKHMQIPGLPDIEFLISPSGMENAASQESFHLTDETFQAVWGNLNRVTDFLMYVVLLKPKSIGYVTIKSNDPFDFPIIDPKFLSDAENVDIDAIYEATEYLLSLLKTDHYKKLNVTLIKVVFEACKDTEYLSKEYWYCTIRQITMNVYHPVGTCKMDLERHGGIVNKDLKVYGVKRLRVADGSVLPFSLSGHPSMASIMIGEKLSDMLKKQYMA